MKHFYLITLSKDTVKHPWFMPFTWRNRVMFERRSVDFNTISAPFTLDRSKVFVSLWFSFVTSWRWLGLWRHCASIQLLERVHCTEWECHLCMEWLLQFTSDFVLSSNLVTLSVGCNHVWNPPDTGRLPLKRLVTRGFDGFFMCVWTNSWASSRHAGDLRRHDSHCDVSTMWYVLFKGNATSKWESKDFPESWVK